MAKRDTTQPIATKRELPPLTGKDDKNRYVLMCPWCKPSHPISLTESSPCGVIAEVRAVQTVFRAKHNKTMVCAKCRKGGGSMIIFQNGFIHTHDCVPGTTMVTIPKFSKLAAWVHGLRNAKIKEVFEKRYGKASPVKDVKPDGTQTGTVLGYIFYKGNS